MNENENIIELISKHTKVLLLNHWPDISDFRNGAESIKIGFSHDVAYEGQERVIETTISFGKRVKDSTVDRLNTLQMNLELSGNKNVPAKRGRGRPKKTPNIVHSSFTGVPPQPVEETD